MFDHPLLSTNRLSPCVSVFQTHDNRARLVWETLGQSCVVQWVPYGRSQDEARLGSFLTHETSIDW